MSPQLARPLLHTVHLLTSLLLLATGLLLFVPNLRATVTGGYSLLIRQSHRWGGVAFCVLPALILAAGGVRVLFAPPPERTLRALWQGSHVAITVGLSVVFTLTGFVIWYKRLVPESLVEVSRATHDALTYAIAILVVAHLIEVGGAALVARFTAAARATHSVVDDV